VKYIVPLLKSPLALPGEKWWQKRYGSKEKQDWYQILEKTAHVFRESDPEMTMVLVVSENCFGGIAETETYVDNLIELGIPSRNIEIIRKGRETIGQMNAAVETCEAMVDTTVFVCSRLHWLRVHGLAAEYSKNTEVVSVGGIPRPIEAVTDLLLAFVFPTIDLFGGRDWFIRKTTGRRAAGVL
jgi:hypothetical protein